MESYVTDEMRGIVGKVMTVLTSFPLSASDIRKWAAAVYYPEVPPPLFAAAGAPRTRHQELNRLKSPTSGMAAACSWPTDAMMLLRTFWACSAAAVLLRGTAPT